MGRSPVDIHDSSVGVRRMKRLDLPLREDDVSSLRAGDYVSLFGKIVTGRDILHRYLATERPKKDTLPCDLEGGILYHCGPIVRVSDGAYRVVSAGPTTSMRVEPYTASIIAKYGLRGIMGKGGMGKRTMKALTKYGCVYLHTIGGAGAYLADRVRRVVDVWKYDEFGMTEAMWILEVHDFPAIVTMDAYGNNLHAEIERESRAAVERLLA